MSSNRKRPSRLGRGLSSLMSTPQEPQPVEVPAAAGSSIDTSKHSPPKTSAESNTPSAPTGTGSDSTPSVETGLARIRLDQIVRNDKQPRETFKPGAVEALAKSIREQGVMQPIVVRPMAVEHESKSPNKEHNIRYQIVAGERRWRAAAKAGLEVIPAVIHELTDEQTAEWALVENLQREDLNPIEKAVAFRRLADEFKLTQVQIAERMGLERSTITNHLRLLDLSDVCLDLIKQDLLSMGHARAIAGLPSNGEQQIVAQKAVREQWSVRKVEQEVRRRLNPDSTTIGTSTSKSANHHTDLEKQISEQLGTKVHIKTKRKKGTGSLTIEFYSLDQFDELLTRMQVEAN